MTLTPHSHVITCGDSKGFPTHLCKLAQASAEPQGQKRRALRYALAVDPAYAEYRLRIMQRQNICLAHSLDLELTPWNELQAWQSLRSQAAVALLAGFSGLNTVQGMRIPARPAAGTWFSTPGTMLRMLR